jgi:hypothetical protein
VFRQRMVFRRLFYRCSASGQSCALPTCLNQVSNGTRFRLNLTDIISNIPDRAFVQSRCFRQARLIIDADFAMARETGKLWGKNSYRFDESPRSDGQ